MDRRRRKRFGIDPVDIRRRNLVPQFPLYLGDPASIFDEGSYLANARSCGSKRSTCLPSASGKVQARQQGRYLGLGIFAFSRAHRVTARRPSPRAAWTSRRARRRSRSPWTHRATSNRASAPRRTGRGCARRSRKSSPTSSASSRAGQRHSWRYRPHALWLGHICQPLAGHLGRRAHARGRKVPASSSAIAARMLEAAPTISSSSNGAARVAGTDRAVAIETLARAAYHQAHLFKGELDAGLRRPRPTIRRAPSPMPVTPRSSRSMPNRRRGHRRFVVAEDAGILVNPMIADGQVAGGVAQGIANALSKRSSMTRPATSSPPRSPITCRRLPRNPADRAPAS